MNMPEHSPRPWGPILTRDAARRLDHLAVERFGMSLLVLMENAARALADACAAELQPERSIAQANVLIACGGGNNGGDGLAAARHLANAGARVRLLLAQGPRTPETTTNHRICLAMGLTILGPDADPLRTLDAAWPAHDPPHLIVDALLGTGLDRPVEGPMAALIHALDARARAQALPVVAADIPTGLCAQTGRPLGVAMHASVTVTFAALKPGLLVPGASAWTGRVVVGDIGVPRTLIEELSRTS